MDSVTGKNLYNLLTRYDENLIKMELTNTCKLENKTQ